VHSSSSEAGPPVGLKGRVPDALLALLALLMGLPSLTFPFGRDQGLYFYVAREWVRHGAIPYRDVLDHKTPGIYVLHAISILLFGERMWGIRVFDIVAVFLVGWLAARAVTERNKVAPAGLVGLSILSSSILFFGYLNWWDTAQSEIWYGMFGLASAVAVWHVRNEPRAQVLGGLFAGLAFAMKPPSVWLIAVAALVLLVRVRQQTEKRPLRSALGLLRFGAGASAPLLVVGAYFGAHYAISAMLDIVVGANGYYVSHEKGVTDLGAVAIRSQEYLGYYQPFSTLGIGATTLGVAYAIRAKNSDRLRRWGFALASCAAACAAVGMQGKFYLLHWGVMVPAATIVFAAIAHEVIAFKSSPLLPGTTPRAAILRGFLFFGFASCGTAARMYYLTSARSLAYARGAMSWEEYVIVFAWPDIGFYYVDSHRVGAWLAAHSSVEDRIAIRGFNPEIYAVANCRHQGRFFWTPFITQPARAYRRAEWLAEDLRDLNENPPRFAVALIGVAEGPDSPSYFPGYVERARFGGLAILERPSP
jgi:uncharacterized membrane protein (UPF0136 family)